MVAGLTNPKYNSVMFARAIGSTGETILVVTGIVDFAADLGHELEDLASSKFKTITLDLKKGLGISSQSIGKLILLKRKVADQGKELRIRGCSELLFGIFKMIKLDSIMSIEP